MVILHAALYLISDVISRVKTTKVIQVVVFYRTEITLENG